MSKDIEESNKLSLNFDSQNLVAAIAQDYKTKEVLMLAWMNHEAFEKTLETGEAHYWSRSRGEIWHKGATSGAVQKIHEIRIDCDQDAVILFVEQASAGACHTGRRSCFYRRIEPDGTNGTVLVFINGQ